MSFDLSINLALILTILTFVSGIVVALDTLVWKTNEKDTREVPKPQATLVEYSRSFFPVLLFVLVIRSFIFEPFRIPSGSMKPTLVVGDFIFVKKFSYGLRLPVTETKFIETGNPERGDVAVFRLPSDPKINYIKRVVGLPGDEVLLERQRLTVNGVTMDLTATGETFEGAPVYLEDLDGRVHRIMIYESGYTRMDGVYIVPEGEYLMMGDNRDRSKDSRYIGTIPEKYLVGEAVRVWMHFVPGSMPDWARIGTKIE